MSDNFRRGKMDEMLSQFGGERNLHPHSVAIEEAAAEGSVSNAVK